MYQNNNSGGRSQSGYGGGNGNRNGGGFGGGNRNFGDSHKSSNASELPDDKPASDYVPLTEDNYVKVAEDSIEALKKHTDRRGNPKVLTTSKIRNILALNAEIYNDIMNEKDEALSDEFKGRINYLKVRIIYEAGRESTVMCFVTESHLLDHLNKIQGKKSQYLLFSRFLEALVAFRKFKFMKDE